MSLGYIIRYEMYCYGHAQSIGIFRGLDETNLGEGLKYKLTYPFDENLPMPPSDSYTCDETNKYIASFFTEKGEDIFKEHIYKLAKEVNEDEVFSVGKVLVKEKEENIVYKDKFQCLFKFFDLSDITGLVSKMEEGFYKILENNKTRRIYNYELKKILDVDDFNEDVIIYPNYLEEDIKYILDTSQMIIKLC